MRAGYFGVAMGSCSRARIVRSTSDILSSGNTYSRSSKSGTRYLLVNLPLSYSMKSTIIILL